MRGRLHRHAAVFRASVGLELWRREYCMAVLELEAIVTMEGSLALSSAEYEHSAAGPIHP